MKWFVNYQEISALSVADRSIAYGDGVFETLLLTNGKPNSISLHKQRLQRAMLRLKFNEASIDYDQIFDFIEQQSDSQQKHQVAKIIVSRGSGGRGYLPPQEPNYSIIIGISPYQKNSESEQQGVRLELSNISCAINRSVAGLKHLNRLENVLAKQDLSTDCYEGIMLDEDGYLVECIQSNIFWFKDKVLYTPLLNRSGVQGTMRNKINQFMHGVVQIGQYPIEALLDADEAFICNGLTRVLPVRELKGFRTFEIGKQTRLLQQTFNS